MKIVGIGLIVVGFLVVSHVHAATMPVPTMTWVYPNADMEFEVGKTYPLQWTGTNPAGGNYFINVGFERVGAPVPFSPGSYGMIGMGYNLPLSGSWNWKAGYTGSSNDLRMVDGEYRLVAVLYSLTQGKEIARDYSDGIITITSSSTVPAPITTPPPPLASLVTVLAPVGGEYLTIGSTTTVAWEAINPNLGNYMVNLGIEPVGDWRFQAGSFGIIDGGLRFPLSGIHEWRVGMTGSDGDISMPPGEYRLAVVLHSFKTNSDLSRGYSGAFTIGVPSPTPSSTSQSADESQVADSTPSPEAINKSQPSDKQPTPTAVVESTPAATLPAPSPFEDAKMRDMSEQIKALRAQLEILQNARHAKAQVSVLLSPEVGAEKAFIRNLRFGMRNDADVRALQTILTREGAYTEEITGNFLAITRVAVIAFQKKYGIDPQSGFVGPLTRAKLRELGGS